MKLLIVCRSFNNMAGGIERMATAIMNDMVARGHVVSLLTWDMDGSHAFYDLNPSINWVRLNEKSHIQKAGTLTRLRRMKKFREIISVIKPDVILAFQHGTFLATRAYTFGMNVPVVAAEREAPSRFDHLKAGKWQNLIYQSFRLADKVTIQCESYRDQYPAYLREKIITIPNPVRPAQKFASPAGSPGTPKTLLCVGRLSYQKNQAALIAAFAKIADRFPDWSLLFAGEGEDRKTLEQQIHAAGLENRISMPGAIRDTESLYCNAHLLCLPARWEGFPNVVAEALSHGLPVVGYAGCAGTSDLVQDGITGILAAGNGDVASLSNALAGLMSDDVLREKMGRAGIESMKPFAPDKIFDLWDDLFKKYQRS